MSTPSRSSSSSGRGTGCRKRGTQHTVTQTPYQTRGTTARGIQRDNPSRGSQRQRTSTPAGNQQSPPLSQEDLAKITELVARQLPIHDNDTQTAASSLVPPASLPATTVIQSSSTTPTSSPAVTVAQSSLTTPPVEVGTSTPIMAVARTIEQVSVTGAHQMQAAVGGMTTQATPDEGQPLLDVPCKLLIRGYVHVYSHYTLRIGWPPPSITGYAGTASCAAATPSNPNYKHLCTANYAVIMCVGCTCIIVSIIGLRM